jgi:hypothetical protein
MNGGKMSQKLSSIAYNRMVTNTGLYFQERQKEDTTCELFGTQLKSGSIKAYQITQRCITNRETHRNEMIEQMIEKIQDINTIECQSIVGSHFDSLTNSTDRTENQETTPLTYHVDMDIETISSCPVINCPYSSETRQRIRCYFTNMHNYDVIIINQECLLPRCIECGLFQAFVGTKHMASATCIKYAKLRKDWENDKKSNSIIANTTFSITGLPIDCVKDFKYLGRYLSEDDNDWKAINWNIKSARISWGRLARILSSEKATSKSMASIY